MIDNNFLVNVGKKDLNQNQVSDNGLKNTRNIKKDFSKVLTQQQDKPSNYHENTNKELNNNSLSNGNKVEKSNIENTVEKVKEIITNEENFQGNKIDGEALEEIVSLLNQIINSPEIKSLMPLKLEDPMMVSGEAALGVESEAFTSENSVLKDIFASNNISSADLSNVSNLANNIEQLQNSNNSKEALSIATTILETLNSKNIDGMLSPEDIDGVKNVLEGLVDKIFKSDTNLLGNVEGLKDVVNLNGQEITSKDFKLDKEIKLNHKVDATSEELNTDITDNDIKNILTDLKSSVSSERNTTIKQSEISGMDKIGSAPEAVITDDEDKVLAKILGSDSVSGSLNRQDALLNRLNIKAPDVSSEPMVVNKETMDADIIKNVKFMIKNQVSELKVKIYPKELGEMTIKLLSEEGILKADIKAVSKETYNLLNSNINEIKKSLEQQNIKIHEVNIGLYSDDTTYHSGEKGNDEMFKNNENSRNKQGKDSSSSTNFLSDDFEEEQSIYADSSVDLLV